MEVPEVTVGSHQSTWRLCGACWGQRAIYHETGNGGLAACMCPYCLGVGETLALSPTPASPPLSTG